MGTDTDIEMVVVEPLERSRIEIKIIQLHKRPTATIMDVLIL